MVIGHSFKYLEFLSYKNANLPIASQIIDDGQWLNFLSRYHQISYTSNIYFQNYFHQIFTKKLVIQCFF